MGELDTPLGRSDVEVIDRSLAYDGFFKLYRLRLRHRLFEGGWSGEMRRELFARDHAVCVLLYDPDQDRVVLIQQFRVGALQDSNGPWLWELVAGIVEPGETVEAVAHREAREEADASLQALVPICDYHVSPGGSEEFIHLLCARTDARELGGIHGLQDEHENIRVEVVKTDDAYQAVVDGRINNAPTIIALQWLMLNRDRLRQQWCTES